MRGRLALTAVVVVLGAAAVLRPPAPFTADAGPKLLQAEAFAWGVGLPRSVPYPAAELDPDRRWVPPFMVPVGDGLASVYPVLFPLVAAVPVRVAGRGAAWSVPFLCAIAAAWLAGGLVRRLAGGDAAEPAVVVLAATPLAFYALTLWEQTLALVMVLGAITLVVAGKRSGSSVRWAAAGVLLAAACWTRTEVVVLLPLLGLPVVAGRWRPAVSAVAGGTAGLAIGAALQRVLLGAWRPLHLDYHAAPLLSGPGPVRERLQTFVATFIPEPLTTLATVVWVIAVIAALHPRWRERILTAILSTGAPAAALAAAFVAPAGRFMAGASPTEAFPFASPAATWLPVAALPAVLAGASLERRSDRWLWAIAGVAAWYLLIVTLAKPARSPEWGHRLLLPAAVLLTVVVLALARGQAGRVRFVVATCILGGIAVQGLGVALNRHGCSAHARVVSSVLAATGPGEVVVTDTPIVVLGSGTGFAERKFMFCASSGSLGALAEGLARAGETGFVLATVIGSAGAGLDPGEAVGIDRGLRWRRVQVEEIPVGRRTLRLARYEAQVRTGAW